MRFYRITALVFALAFAAVGLVFLFAPGSASTLFDVLGRRVGIPGVPGGNSASGLFRALAAAYMYGVTLIAWTMYRRPAERAWPALLAHAKLASASASFILVALDGVYLVYLVNGVVDGLIGVVAIWLRRCMPAEGTQEMHP